MGFPFGQCGACGFQIITDLASDFGVFAGDIRSFGNVMLLIKKLQGFVGVSLANAFPSALMQRRLLEAAFVKFPVEKLMLFLLLCLTCQFWD